MTDVGGGGPLAGFSPGPCDTDEEGSGVLPHGYTEFVGAGTSSGITETFSIAEGKFSAQRFFTGPWDNRFNFCLQYLFAPFATGGSQVIGFRPKWYPDYKNSMVTNIEITGISKPGHNEVTGQAKFELARITATYESVPATVTTLTAARAGQAPGNRETVTLFIEESIESDIELKTWSGENFNLEDELGDKKNQHDRGWMAVPFIQLIITLKSVFCYNPNWEAIKYNLGKVHTRPPIGLAGRAELVANNPNLSAINFKTPSGFECESAYPNQTLRYDGISAMTKVDVFSGEGTYNNNPYPLPIWEISHQFTYNPDGWNNERDADGVLKKLRRGDGSHIFGIGDLYRVFLNG